MSAAETEPITKYFMAPSRDLAFCFSKPARAKVARLASSKAQKSRIRSFAEATIIIPKVAKSTRV